MLIKIKRIVEALGQAEKLFTAAKKERVWKKRQDLERKAEVWVATARRIEKEGKLTFIQTGPFKGTSLEN
jgi:hypothetical protein